MPVAGRYGGQKQFGAVASSACKYYNNKIVTGRYGCAAVRTVFKVSSSVCKYKKNEIITGQQYGSAAVRTVVKGRGVQHWERWYSQAPVGGRYFRNKKKVHLPQDEKRLPRTERPTHPPRTTPCTLHPPTDQTVTTYSSTAVQQYTWYAGSI